MAVAAGEYEIKEALCLDRRNSTMYAGRNTVVER